MLSSQTSPCVQHNFGRCSRPLNIKVYVVLMGLSGLFMVLLGLSASAYYVPALCLFLQGGLLWWARGFAFFRVVLILNQLSGLLLILVLWLWDSLGLGGHKLDVSGVMLLINLLCGGPLMSLLAIPILPSLRHGHNLYDWFHARSAPQIGELT